MSDHLWSHAPHIHSDAAIDEKLDHLEHRIEKMTIINRALWEIIQHEHPDLHKDTLVAKIAEIDLRDGKLDNQISAPAMSCPSCGRKTARSRKRCIYCGAEIPQDTFAGV